MKTLVLTIVMLAMLITGAACSGGAGMLDVEDQQQNAASDDASRNTSWACRTGGGI